MKLEQEKKKNQAQETTNPLYSSSYLGYIRVSFFKHVFTQFNRKINIDGSGLINFGFSYIQIIQSDPPPQREDYQYAS